MSGVSEKKIPVALSLFLFLFTACDSPTDQTSKNATAIATSQPTPVVQQLNTTTSNEPIIITDINNWNHPIKTFFNDWQLAKVELINEGTYPIFYLKDNLSKEDIIDNDLNGGFQKMLAANGYWDFEIRYRDSLSIKVKGDKSSHSISKIILNNDSLAMDKYEKEYEMVFNVLTKRLIKNDESSEYYYLRSPLIHDQRPSENADFYQLRPVHFDLKSESYVFLLSRKTDTVATYYHAKVKNDHVSFYYDTPTVKNDDSVSKEIDRDYLEVEQLFAERYLIKNPDQNDDRYALKTATKKFLYRATVYDYSINDHLYHFRVSRSTDTANNFFLYDSSNDKFYREGKPMTEIKSPDDIFIWIP